MERLFIDWHHMKCLGAHLICASLVASVLNRVARGKWKHGCHFIVLGYKRISLHTRAYSLRFFFSRLDLLCVTKSENQYIFVSRVGLVSKCVDQDDVELIRFEKELLFLLLQASFCR